jgi:ribosomal protein S27AE
MRQLPVCACTPETVAAKHKNRKRRCISDIRWLCGWGKFTGFIVQMHDFDPCNNNFVLAGRALILSRLTENNQARASA